MISEQRNINHTNPSNINSSLKHVSVDTVPDDLTRPLQAAREVTHDFITALSDRLAMAMASRDPHSLRATNSGRNPELGRVDKAATPGRMSRRASEPPAVGWSTSYDDAISLLSRWQQERLEAANVAVADRNERIIEMMKVMEEEHFEQLMRSASRYGASWHFRRNLFRYYLMYEPDLNVSGHDFKVWEFALDVIRRSLTYEDVPRFPELFELFETAGLGLTSGGVYRLGFASKLKQQMSANPQISALILDIVMATLLHCDVHAVHIQLVAPRFEDWQQRMPFGIEIPGPFRLRVEDDG